MCLYFCHKYVIMKYAITLFIALAGIMVLSQCSSKEPQETKESTPKIEQKDPAPTPPASEKAEEGETVGDEIPEIPAIQLAENIDEALANSGAAVFNTKCGICHKPTERFIGPAPQGILERRDPNWIMKVIMYPELMQKQDPIIKQLVKEYNGAVMPNQNITFEEARSVIEYYRTIE